MNDWVSELEAIVAGYVDDVLAGRRVVGKLERLAVERHVADMRAATDGTRTDLRFNRQRAGVVLLFPTFLVRHVKGEFGGQQFKWNRTSAWEAFILWNLFGWERKYSDGRWGRRFRLAYISVARKNGKTFLAAIIALFMTAFEGEAGSEVYFVATKKDQAALGWKAASAIIRKDKNLRKVFDVTESRYNFAHKASESICEALSRDSDTMDGKNPYGVIIDEYHAHPSSDAFDVMWSGMGARREPLAVVITTAGSNASGPCFQMDQDCQSVLVGAIADDTTFAYIARIDEDDDWDDESVWQKANPNLGESINIDVLRDDCAKAKSRLSYRNEYRRKRCNQWTEVGTVWLSQEHYTANGSNPDPPPHASCWIGVDISSTTDLTAVVAVFDVDGYVDVIPQFFIPEESIWERRVRDRVPYDVWRDDGYIVATPGSVVDQEAIREYILALHSKYTVQAVAYDPWNAVKLATDLTRDGVLCAAFRQGYASMGPATSELERLFRLHQIRHGNHPVLRWCFTNVSPDSDPAGNIKFSKKGKERNRIDGMVALAMAVGAKVGTLVNPDDEIIVVGA